MNTDAFITCLGYVGVSTGTSASLEAVYSPASGTTGYFYNQLYSTGSHIQSGLLYAPVLPLINIYNSTVINNIFTGGNGYRVGYQHSGNFSVLMDIEYSGCSRSAFSQGKGNILLSTVDSPINLQSGFIVAINDANRLFFKTATKAYTLSTELSTRDLVYISLTENQYVTVGIYKIAESQMYSLNTSLDSSFLNNTSLYFGNFLNNTSTGEYYGYEGKINQVILFNDDLSDSDIGQCAICSYVTGYNKNSLITPISGFQFTGYSFSGFQTFDITNNAIITGQVYRNDGSFINVLYPSGIVNISSSGELAIPLFQQVSIQTSGDYYNFSYDNISLNSFNTYNIEFDMSLTSGDIIEVYTYPSTNNNVNKSIYGVEWPEDTGIIQLIGNGLSETLGIDYYIVHNAISGYYSDDILTYDVISQPSVVTSYSGYWFNNKILMSGGSYFPSTPQYLENTGSFSGIVKITGLNLVCTGNPFYPSFGYDLHMNGQKMISGLQFDVSPSGAGYVVNLSGAYLPQIYCNLLYHPTGGLPTGVSEIDDNELSFIPQFSGFRTSQFIITGNVKTLGPITGCSEQIWLNGIRQRSKVDYLKRGFCDEIPNILYPPNLNFTVYDSNHDNGYWNFI
jgi:hypothetical protein